MLFPIRFCLVCAGIFASAVILHRISVRTKPGWSRLIACLPILVYNCVIPSVFSPKEDFNTTALIVILQIWVSNFKILAFCIGRGPLCQDLAYHQFLLVSVLAIFPDWTEGSFTKQADNKKAGWQKDRSKRILRELAGKFVSGIVMVLLVSNFSDNVPVVAMDLMNFFILYAFCGAFSDIGALMLLRYAGLPIVPTFDSPWLSASFAEWHGRRWNLSISTALRMLVYDPICEGSLFPAQRRCKGDSLQAAVATFSTFLVSGIMHYIVLWYFDDYCAYQSFLFFILQGALVLLERKILRYAKEHSFLPPRWIRIPFTLIFLVILARPFLLYPPEKAGLGDTASSCIQEAFKPIMGHS